MPKIESLDDVYEVGALCEARAIRDEANTFTPYVLNIFPRTKARLVSKV